MSARHFLESSPAGNQATALPAPRAKKKDNVLLIVAQTQTDALRALLNAHNRPPEIDVHWCDYREAAWGIEFARPVGIVADSIHDVFFKTLLDTRLPLVNLTTHSEAVRNLAAPSAPVAHVCIDEMSVGALAAQHLLDAGYRNFGFVNHAGVIFSEIRQQGFSRELQRHGFACRSCQRVYDQTPAGWGSYRQFRDDMDAFLRAVPKPAGVMAADDYLGYETLRSCQELGLSVPAELAVIGVNNQDLYCQVTTPALSSVMLPYDAQATQAWDALLKLMQGQAPSNSLTLMAAARIALRNSTQSHGKVDPDLASALEFIHANSHIKLSVDQVVDHVAISRRALELHFHQALGRSILHHIHVQRIEWHKELLANPALKIAAIARRAGFVQPEKFAKFFKSHTGMTPTDFRARLFTHPPAENTP